MRFRILIYEVKSWWQITAYKLALANSNKTHTFILLTLYHLVGPIYTQGMEEGKWNDPVKKLCRVEKKINYSYLRGLLIFMRTNERSACLLLHRKKLFTIFCLQFVMHWSLMNTRLPKGTFDRYTLVSLNSKTDILQISFKRYTIKILHSKTHLMFKTLRP